MTQEEQQPPLRPLSRREFFSLRWTRARVRPGDGPAPMPLGPGSMEDPARFMPLGTPDELRALPLGSVRRARMGAPVYLTRLAEGLLAVSARCPGDDCLVSWRDGDPSEDAQAETGRFYCACDASIFDRRGLLAAGPAPRALDALPIVPHGDMLWADSGQPIRRDREDQRLGEAVYPLPGRDA